jgi:PAS domain S-box-containing protein
MSIANFVNDSDQSATSPPGTRESAHLVQFYEADSFLLEALSKLIGDSLVAGDSSVVIATEAHRDGLAEALHARGLDIDTLRSQGRYVALDAAETLASFMVNDFPDEDRFRSVIGDVIKRAIEKSDSHHVSAYGEMVALLFAEGKGDALLRLEELWNALGKQLPFSLCCGYPLNQFSERPDEPLFLKICAEHSHVVPAESYTELASPEDRRRSVTYLQHKAQMLEGEKSGRKKAEKSLSLRQKELTDFLENAAEGIHQVGPDARILWANRAQLRLLGYSANEYVGHQLADFFVQRDLFDDFWRRIMAREVIYDFPAALRGKDGSTRQVLIHSSGYWQDSSGHNPEGKFLYTRCFIRDVTERAQLEDELREKVVQLEEADQRKNEFLAMLGHELRNPLSAVSNAVATAHRDASRRDRALDIASRQTAHLGRIVDDLLDVARITKGKIALQKEPVQFGAIVNAAVEEMRDLLESRRQHLTVSIPVNAEKIKVEADRVRMQQVVGNLIHNAIKFTPPGGMIDVVLYRKGDQAVLRVRDSGVGISQAMLPRVFDLFSQAQVPPDRTQGGLGIGLTLARQLVEMHGGRIEARSHGLDRGCEFEVSIPLIAERKEKSVPASDTAPGEHAKTRRVLIVEDNVDAAESLSMLLEFLGHEVRIEASGASALEAIRTTDFQAVLVDIGLPDMDGYEVARQIRQLPGSRTKLLVALTGYGQEEDKRRALSAGFDQHLIKPVDVERLQSLLADPSTSTPT